MLCVLIEHKMNGNLVTLKLNIESMRRHALDYLFQNMDSNDLIKDGFFWSSK